MLFVLKHQMAPINQMMKPGSMKSMCTSSHGYWESPKVHMIGFTSGLAIS